ncbi:MAG: hypothetical protein ACHQWU_13625 [Gemmatimonadales bacterium]
MLRGAQPSVGGETVASWLAAARPEAPAPLAERVREYIAAGGARPAAEAPEVCVDAAVALLGELLSRASTGRESALDLLTVDALVTYAFEAATVSADRLRPRALDAMSRLAGTAATAP